MFILSSGICTIAFTWLITDGSFALIYRERFGDFYDFQARSLLAGRLDVPPAVLSGEGFYFGGKCYGYFGICPAVLRLPFVALGIGFGKVSRAFMTIYFMGAACQLSDLYTIASRWSPKVAGSVADLLSPPFWSLPAAIHKEVLW